MKRPRAKTATISEMNQQKRDSTVINWLRRLFHKKPKTWIKKKLIITYWTRAENPATLAIESLKFKSVESSQFYIDNLTIKDEEK